MVRLERFGDDEAGQILHLGPFADDRAGFPFQLDFELLDGGGHELLLFFGTSHTDGILKMKDSMWHVDRVNGRRFRDPKDPNLALAIQDEPDLSVYYRFSSPTLKQRAKLP